MKEGNDDFYFNDKKYFVVRVLHQIFPLACFSFFSTVRSLLVVASSTTSYYYYYITTTSPTTKTSTVLERLLEQAVVVYDSSFSPFVCFPAADSLAVDRPCDREKKSQHRHGWVSTLTNKTTSSCSFVAAGAASQLQEVDLLNNSSSLLPLVANR